MAGREREREILMIQTFDYLSLKSCSSVTTGKSHSSFVAVAQESELSQAKGAQFVFACVMCMQAFMCERMSVRPKPCVNYTAEQYINNRSTLPLFGT